MKNNESAFPEPFVNDPHLSLSHTKGMTLRDYFAAKAMTAAVQDFTNFQRTSEDYEEVAEKSYKIADAMLKQREK